MKLTDYEGNGGGMEGYFAFLRERYRIMLNRQKGLAPPWTSDTVLQQWRFCNVRREDDKVTTWFRDNIRDELKDHPSVLFATAAFRWFNTIETGKTLRPWLLGPWDRKEVRRALEKQAKHGDKLFTGAFVVNSKGGKKKHIDVLDNLDSLKRIFYKDQATLSPHSMPWNKASMFHALTYVPRLGNFAAYQIVVDLQYTYLLRDAMDLNTFTVAGPGCARGISLMRHNEPDWMSFTSQKDQRLMLGIMLEALDKSRQPRYWPVAWPPFVLSDIENGFCEYSKFRAAHAGARLKRRYR